VTVYLRQSRHAGSAPAGLSWFAVAGAPGALSRATRVSGLARLLEEKFAEIRPLWWRLGRAMGGDASAEVSHAAACGAFGSDFGLMLAWSRLVEDRAAARNDCLVLCDDPWLFRHLTGIAGVDAGPAPALAGTEWKLRLRGIAARARLAVRLVIAHARTRTLRRAHGPGDTAILVYGHPDSTAAGFDVYFGRLMAEIPHVRRMLHTDCPAPRARELAADGRTASLHAWGDPLFAFGLIAAAWTPRRELREGPYGWLIRRAAARENGGGGPAMNRWQIHCQARWLAAGKPCAVAWPWENHAWERALCRRARAAGVQTVGYQHTVIGPHQINYAIYSNPDGPDSIPDKIVADGPAYRDETLNWGIPAERLVIGGAFRFDLAPRDLFDPNGPVFIPLSAIPAIASLQLEAARVIASSGRPVLVKEHPMYPFAFDESNTLRRTEVPLTRQGGLSAVVYATGTSGLESLLAGVPTLRLLSEDRLSIDVLPAALAAVPVELDGLLAALAHARPPEPIARADILAPVDWTLWRALLGNDGRTNNRVLRKIA
jgi:hypothetical protein